MESDRIDLWHIARKLLHGWNDILIVTVPCILVAVAYLTFATYYYQASLVLVPVSGQNSNGLGQLSGLASLAGVNLSDSDSVSPFTLFPETMKSSAVADDLARTAPDVMHHLFRTQWDEGTHQWKPSPHGLMMSIIRAAFGRSDSDWIPPSAADVKDILDKSVQAQQDLKKPILTVSFSDPDRVFAGYFLLRLTDSTDRVLRQMTLQRTTRYAKYLQDNLQTAQSEDMRQILIHSLSTQETLIMMASSSNSFAAQMLGGPTVSKLPTFPNKLLVLVVSILIGFGIGSGLVLMDASIWRFLRRVVYRRSAQAGYAQ